MNFIRESIKNRTYVKKGFTLIELMLVSVIIGIITSTQVVIMCKYMKIHRQEINLSRESFYVNEGFFIIQQQIDKSKYVKVKDNQIIIKRSDNEEFDYIKKNRNSNTIVSYGSKESSTTNNILKDIKDFKVEKYRQVLYISIQTKEGNVYKRCFALEREEREEKGKDSY